VTKPILEETSEPVKVTPINQAPKEEQKTPKSNSKKLTVESLSFTPKCVPRMSDSLQHSDTKDDQSAKL